MSGNIGANPVSDIPCDDNFYDVLSIPVASGNNMQCKNNPRCTHL
ncbi:type IV secretion protein Rhs [Escherichia coli]|nr:type IV secretion protein Rhs [Escherichia coli]